MKRNKKQISVRLAFHDWIRDGESVYGSEEGIELSIGNFHSGTVFSGTIILDDDDANDLLDAINKKAYPAFLMVQASDGFKDGSGDR